MSSLNGRKVKIARLHSIIHIPGIGQLGPAIDENSAKMLGAVSLTKVEDGVLVKVKTFEVLVPIGNIVSLLFYPEEQK